MKQQLKCFTLDDFDKFERVGSRTFCPTGDYTEIKEFPMNCVFGEYSKFGDKTVFGRRCVLERYCNIGESCVFGSECYIGKCSYIGDHCSFASGCEVDDLCFVGDFCIFQYGCRFGKGLSKIGVFCQFAELCEFYKGTEFPDNTSFGAMCKFGDDCTFGKDCQCEDGHTFVDMFKISGLGKRKETVYFWELEDGSILVRCGEFCVELTEFYQLIRSKRGDDRNVEEYIRAADFAKFKIRNLT